MKTASGRLAVLAFALAGVTALVPVAPAVPAEPVEPVPVPPLSGEERPAPQSLFAGTAIGFVLEANGNEVPKSGEQMMKVLAKFGEVAQLPITFSAVDLHTSLTSPRVVFTLRPSMITPGMPAPGAAKPAGWPEDLPFPPVVAPGFGTPPAQTALHTGKLTAPNLEGRLFLAANFEKKGGELKVKTFEFISWSSRKQRFDFGFIECDDAEPQIRLVDGVKCFSCHKNKGPILGQGPWSNTPHNDVLRVALQNTLMGADAPAVPPKKAGLPAGFGFPFGGVPFLADGDLGQPRRLDTGFGSRGVDAKRPKGDVADGLSIIQPQGPAVDAAIRLGADLAIDRDVYRSMARSQDGRKGLVILLAAIATPGPLELTGGQVRPALDAAYTTNFLAFAEKWHALHKTGVNTLIDFNPAGSVGTLQQTVTGLPGGWGGGSTLQTDLKVVWSGDSKQITEYDQKRADGDHGLPSARQPSNPKAFVRPPVPQPSKPSAAVHAITLARLIGLTDGDRAFLAEQLTVAVRRIDKKVTPAALAKEVFGGPQFAEVLTAGEIPDREDFKDRFVKGLDEVLKASGAEGLKLNRASYASGPNVAPLPGKEEKELPVVATTACIRCHDVRGIGKPAFNPIPMLAFDPFDKTSREAWVKANPDAKKRLPVLARIQKRLDGDKDMPPEDSAEYDTFRTKTPGAFDAMHEWLDAELKKAKGG